MFLKYLNSFAFVLLLFFGICASSQTPTDESPGQTSSGPDHLTIGSVHFGGSWRGRAEGWNWFLNSDRTRYAFGESLLNLSFSQNRHNFQWQLDFEQPLLLNLPDNAINQGTPLGLGGTYFLANGAERNAGNVFVKQAYARFRGLAGNHDHLQVGRFQFTEGLEGRSNNPTVSWLRRERIAGRLIGSSDWTASTRSLDGIKFSDDIGQRNSVTLAAARVTPGVYQTNGWGELNVDVIYGSFTRELTTHTVFSEFRAFGIGYHDGRQLLKVDNRSLAAREADHRNIRIGTFGLDYLLVIPAPRIGRWDLLAWGAIQTGQWGTLHQHAASGTAELVWQPPVKWLHPWLRAGALTASADGDPNDSRHTTFFQLLPNDRQYSPIPFYALENLEDYTGQLVLRPSRQLRLKSELHKVKLHGRHDLWYQGAGAFQASSFGYLGAPPKAEGGLANYVTAQADWQSTPRFRISYFLGVLSGKATFTSDLRGRKAGFTYLQTEYRF